MTEQLRAKDGRWIKPCGADGVPSLAICSVDTCDRRARTRGLCDGHYQRFLQGRPLDGPLRAFNRDSRGVAHYKCRVLWGPARDHSCIECGKLAKHWAYDGTDPTERATEHGSQLYRYSLYPEFYMPMCTSCHHAMDKGRAAAELREYRLWKHETGLTLADVTALLNRTAA